MSRHLSTKNIAFDGALLSEQCQGETIDNTGSSDGPSLVFNESALLSNDFSLRKTLQAIIDSNDAGSGGDTPEKLVSTMLTTFGLSQQTNPLSELTVPVERRDGEFGIDPDSMVSAMTPVGIFNRFDLASSDGASCGEYRVVYAKPQLSQNLPGGPFFMIFEAGYPNPSPEKGLLGCLPIAQFWASLEDSALTQQERVSRLEALFYDGISQGGVRLPAIIDFDHYKAPFGQIRINTFINFHDWQLRDFRTDRVSGRTVLVADPVDNSPLTEFFGGQFSGIDAQEQTRFDRLSNEFRQDFINNQVVNLSQPEVNGLTDDTDIVNAIGANIDNRFVEFQSTASGQFVDSPPNQTDADFRALIESQSNSAPFTEILLNRMESQTCQGCHQGAVSKQVASNVVWPRSLGFTHIGESGRLSPALRNFFLPARKRVLNDFLCNPPTEPEFASELVIEAESASTQNTFSPFEVRNEESASGGQYIVWPDISPVPRKNEDLETNRGNVKYKFTLSQSSNLKFSIQMRSRSEHSIQRPENNDSFFFRVDGEPWLIQNNEAHLDDWGTTFVTVLSSLPAGSHTLSILLREDGTELDSIRLVPDDGLIKAGETDLPDTEFKSSIMIETEAAELQHSFTPFEVISDEDASGGKYIVWPDSGQRRKNDDTNELGGKLDYKFSLLEPSSVDFSIQMRTKSNQSFDGNANNDSFFYRLDGGPWQIQNNNGHSDIWASIFVTRFLGLTEGEHTLNILRREDGTELDALILTPVKGMIKIESNL
ncbi:hypothetical protein BGP75_23705 [Motiliproteus sp. MSK22-1]|nr:hypothetical protein BGP75_23705 [Motiliproteus sp. MSK22-1]